MTTRYFTHIVCKAIDVDKEAFPGVVEEVAAALYKLEGGEGAAFDATPADFTVSFSFVMSGRNRDAVLGRALGIARTALHASGGATPGWPTPDDWPSDFRILEKTAKTERELAST